MKKLSILPILFVVVFFLAACDHTVLLISNYDQDTVKDNVDLIDDGINNISKIDSILVDGKQIKVGKTFLIESTFDPDPYELTLEKINSDNTINVGYSEVRLGTPCSVSDKTASINISSEDKCLFSTTCDGGEKICFSVDENLILDYSISEWDDNI